VNRLEPTLVLIHHDAACVAHPQICSTSCIGLEKLLGALKLSIEYCGAQSAPDDLENKSMIIQNDSVFLGLPSLSATNGFTWVEWTGVLERR